MLTKAQLLGSILPPATDTSSLTAGSTESSTSYGPIAVVDWASIEGDLLNHFEIFAMENGTEYRPPYDNPDGYCCGLADSRVVSVVATVTGFVAFVAR